MLQMQPLSGNQRPDLLTALMNMSFALRLPREMHLCRSSSNLPRLSSLLEMLQLRFAHFWQRAQSLVPATQNDIWTSKRAPYPSVFWTFDFEMCFAPQRRALFRHLKKVVRTWCALCILTWKCASRHNSVHFFDISTSKSGPNVRCFVQFGFETCFAPQRRALFRHLNFQKWSENGVLCTFWLRNVLRATTACNFSSLIWPDGSAPAALASLLFDPPERNGESELTKSEGGRDVGPIDHWRGSNHQLVTCSTSWLVTCEEPSGEALQINATVVSSYQRHWHLEPQATFCSIFSQTLDTLIPVWSSLWTICAWESWFPIVLSDNSWEKHRVSRLSHLFAHLHLLSSDFFDLLSCTLLFSLTLPVSAFHLSILSEVCLASQLPSMNIHAPPAKSHQIITGDFFIAL